METAVSWRAHVASFTGNVLLRVVSVRRLSAGCIYHDKKATSPHSQSKSTSRAWIIFSKISIIIALCTCYVSTAHRMGHRMPYMF